MIRPKSYFDENLRDVPESVEKTKAYVDRIKESLVDTFSSREKVRLLGEIGVYQRRLSELDLSEKSLRDALELIDVHNLGIAVEIQQKIRLAHTLQWKRNFTDSTPLFSEIISTCRNNSEAYQYLDFALQPRGKKLF